MLAVLVGLSMLPSAFSPGIAEASVAVNIKIDAPPPITISAPPMMVVIPGTYVYTAVDVDADIVFYQGVWYRPFRGTWYRSDEYNGRWAAVPAAHVPAAVVGLPPDWKSLPRGHERVPYGQVKQNWKTWERERHWERAERRGARGERIEVHGEERYYDEHRDRKEHGHKDKKHGRKDDRGKGHKEGRGWDRD